MLLFVTNYMFIFQLIIYISYLKCTNSSFYVKINEKSMILNIVCSEHIPFLTTQTIQLVMTHEV